MRVVFLTTKRPFGALLLKQIKGQNISLDAIFIENPKFRHRLRGAIRRLGLAKTLKVALKRLPGVVVPKMGEDWLSNAFYLTYSDKVYIVDDFNGKRCEQLLREIKPDLVVLGRSRIIRKNVINIPRIGILNAHPGLLPKYRGIDTVEWAVYNGGDVGVTIHFIDEGVDTGGIIVQKTVNIEVSDTIASLTHKANTIAAELMTETVLRIMEGEDIRITPQSIEDGRQYFKMPRDLLRQTEQRLLRIAEEQKIMQEKSGE